MKNAVLLAISAIGCSVNVLGMEKANKSLGFLTDENHVIIGCLANNMKFAIPESEFMGKNLVSVIELQGSGNIDVAQAFEEAYARRTVKEVSYKLTDPKFGDKTFVAEIKPLFNDEQGSVYYSVEVTEQ